jgi:hypothetical protein
MALRVEKKRRWVRQSASVAFAVTVPVRVVSEANARGHWTACHKRFAEQARGVSACLASVSGAAVTAAYLLQTGGSASVALTRLGGKALDCDNLAGAFKAIRDVVARKIGVDDGDPAVEWTYGQAPGGDEGIRIDVEVQGP